MSITPVPQVRISNPITRVPLRLDVFFEEIFLSNATAFFYEFDSKIYLITNWHVVTGRNPESKSPLSETSGIPNRLVLYIPLFSKENDVTYLKWRQFELNLYSGDDKDVPTWYEHPTYKGRVDVIAIPMLDVKTDALIPANAKILDLDSFALYPSLDVYVVGYPRGMFGGGKLPIWKRGSIASEPDFDVDGMPKILIDSATREGMSGSPVYVQEVGTWMPLGTTDGQERIFGKGNMLIGVYSGRIGTIDEFKVQLGFVWKIKVVEEIIRGQTLGKSSYDRVAM